MPRIILNIKNVDTVPLLPLIMSGLKVNIKNILLYSENIPESIKQFLNNKLKIKVKLADSCSAYNYILEISGVTKSNSKVVYKENKLLVFLNKSRFIPDDLRVQKIRQAQILTDLELDKKDCKRLTCNDWLIPLMQSDNKIGKLIKAFLSEPLPKFLRVLRTKKDYSIIYNLVIQRLQTGVDTLMFSNINDFNLALVVVAIINLIYLQHYKVKLNNEIICEPVFENSELHCKNTVIFKHEDFTKLSNEDFNENYNSNHKYSLDADFGNKTDGQANKNQYQSNGDMNKFVSDGLAKDDNFNPGSGEPRLMLESKNKQNDNLTTTTKQLSSKNSKQHVHSTQSQKSKQKVDSDSDMVESSNVLNNSKSSISSKSQNKDKKDPLEIDVEEWALKIQKMLGS